jgi:hypothetical protein
LSIVFTQHTGTFTVNTPIFPIMNVWVQFLLAALLIALTAWFLISRRRRSEAGAAP